ncbi:TonB-dependent receptor [Novosphingobium terrae]|uniref:TonB-dependent receptor n=1 Tax=Novosphingobium terrae TaxID=2726189 RepID=UPI0019804583|nr:TonB-dependent receptor [Novosphingobium terrae]
MISYRYVLGCSLGVLAAGIAPALAQQAAAPAGEGQAQTASASSGSAADIVVTGVRSSLRSAETIKRMAPQIIDSIVAEDIGKLPDHNIAEALQRIPGIQVQRNYGEGSTVAIRGLTQARTELNGRDIFTAGTSTGVAGTLSLEDVPSELLAGVDVYKNPSADLIENQLSGTINLRTRKPFDFKGFKFAATATGSYYDLTRTAEPSGSVMISDRWDTGIGEIGILASVSYQRTAFRQDTISTEPFYTLDPTSATDAATLAALGRTGQTTTLPHGAGIGEVYGDRKRFGTDISIQWRPSPTLELTGELFRNDYKFRFDDYSFFAYTSGASITPLPGAPFSFASNGDFVSGAFQNVPIGANTSLDTRHSRTTDYSLNAKWSVTPRLTVIGDFQYVSARTDDLRSIVGLNGTATTLTQNLSGNLPSIQIQSAAGLTNAATYSNGYYLDDLNYATASEKAARIDAEYKFDDGFLKSIKGGFRFSDQNNYGNDTGYRYFGLTGNPTDLGTVDLSNFFRGQANLFGNAQFFSRSTILDYNATRNELGITSAPSYSPYGANGQSQKTYAGYITAFFNFDKLPLPVDGNIGLRVVNTRESVFGAYQQTNLTTASDGTQATGDTSYSMISYGNSYTSVLPSLNLRAHLNDKVQLRFAASQNIFRPTFDQLNPSLSITEPGTAQINQEHDTTGGNPYLKPMKSTNLDLSLEWYFSHTGSLSVAGFYKHIKDYVQTGISERNVTFADGVNATYNVTSYSNVGNANVEGMEVAYQQFFDFLPGLLSGLGMQANFTLVSSQAPGPAVSGPAIQVPLELLSKYNYNLVGIYEKGKISARVAYNWRSKYLVTTAGNGTGNLPIFDKPYGQLDASITYNVTPHVSLTVNAVNLSDSLRQTYAGITTRPRDSILADRQISGILKVAF